MTAILLALVEREVGELRRANSIEGGEYAGPCPWCGGEDRFRVWPERKPKARYFCRQCGRSGDAIDYVRDREGLDYRQAAERLGFVLPALNKSHKTKPEGEPIRETEWHIRDPDGLLVATHTRRDYANGAKSYAWSTPDEPNGLGGLPPADLPLYGIDDLLPDTAESMIVVVEGEKAADALRARNIRTVATVGGASVVPADDVLESLLARDVVLWPDNDEPGRKLMDGIARRLYAMELTPRLVAWQQAPEKGDAADYTGPTEELSAMLASAPPWRDLSKPVIDVLGDRAVRVEMAGAIVLAEDLLKARMAILANLTIWLAGNDDKYIDSIDLMSAGSRRATANDLGEFFTKEIKWQRLLAQAAALIRDAWLGHNPSVDVATEVTDRREERWRAERLLEEGQPTIFFGDGSNGKSFFVLALAIHIALGLGEFCGLAIRGGRVLYVDYETDPATLRFRTNRILRGIDLPMSRLDGLLTYWNPKGKPLADIAESIRRELDRDSRYGLVVIDSAAFAVNGNPNDPDTATAFFDGLAQLEKTSGVVAHVTKAGEQDKPFGSVFWHNGARLTWNVQRTAEAGSNTAALVLYNRKANNTALMAPMGFELAFDGEDGPVTIRRMNETDASWPADAHTARDRILIALRAPMTPDLLAEETGIGVGTLRNKLTELRKAGLVLPGNEGKWAKVAHGNSRP